jgi:HEAT repeat protein
MDAQTRIAHLSDEVRLRRRALYKLALGVPADRFALRRSLWSDPDARLRSVAAMRLGRSRSPDAAPWLVDALSDHMPAVRDASLRALARTGSTDHAAAVSALLESESVWWVRRSAVFTLAVLDGYAAIEPLRRVLCDPFWRLRHASLLALATLGDARESARAQILAPLPKTNGQAEAARQYLALRWSPGVRELPVPPTQEPPAHPDDPLLNDNDPAVVTARLLQLGANEVTPETLCTLLTISHEPLRKVAAERLLEAGPEAASGVSKWLEQPLLPYASDASRALLHAYGELARPLAMRWLESESSTPYSAAWAIHWASRFGIDRFGERLRTLARSKSVIVRRAAVSRLGADDSDVAVLRESLADADVEVRSLAVIQLLACDAEELAPIRAVPTAGLKLEARLAQLESAELDGDSQFLRNASSDAHPVVRATALSARLRMGELSLEEQRAAWADADPYVRSSVLTPERAVEALEHDADMELRRVALTLLVRDPAAASLRSRAGSIARHHPDPWVRANGAVLHDTNVEEELGALLALTRDREPMVRAAAVDVLEAARGLEKRVRALLERANLDLEVRLAAHGWLWRNLTPASREGMLQALADPGQPIEVRRLLSAMALRYDDIAPESLPKIDAPEPEKKRVAPRKAASVPIEIAKVERRALGKTGLQVAPLAISGAFDLPSRVYATALEAGVNTFFWEPAYTELTTFLRRAVRSTEPVIVAGSYHGHASAIEEDIDATLRRLKTDHLGVFLIFWTRSGARLSDEAFNALERAKQAGKIRSFGFSTHDRALAKKALGEHPWPVVMTRHSAAHPGAETAFFPEALARNVGVFTFSALCYGRMLNTVDGFSPEATDCYRYSLSQPGVSACISAPRYAKELTENLQVLGRSTLEPAAQERMRAHGAAVHRENQRFTRLVRNAPEATPTQQLQQLWNESGAQMQATLDAGTRGRLLRRSLGSRGRGRASLPSATSRRG